MEMPMQILLPGEQVMPLPKSSKKNKNKNKPNGFISFANAQRKNLQAQFTIHSQEHLVQLCDPMWRKLGPDEKKMWNARAKDEHARALSGNKRNGVRTDNAAVRMDCNGKIIAERQNAERSSELRRQRERQFVNQELERSRCEEVVDLEFCIIDCLTAIEYTDGECVPCEIGVIKASIREGIIAYYHFFPDPGALRPGFIAEAQIRTDSFHEVPYENFNLASKEYEKDATQLLELIKGHSHSPKTPMLFCRSSEYKHVQSSLDWLSWRVNIDFDLHVMELESFCVDLVSFTKNEPPTFAQVRRLLFETRYDFQAQTRCDYHSMTDKATCAIGNVRKYLFFLCELLYDYYEFDLKEGLHYPKGFKRPKAGGSSIATRSEYDFDDCTSVRSDYSVSSFVHDRAIQNLRKPGDDGCYGDDGSSIKTMSQGMSQMSFDDDVIPTVPRKPVVTTYSQDLTYDSRKTSQKSQNSFVSCVTPPPKADLTYDTHRGSQMSQNSFVSCVTPPPCAPKVNSFSQSPTPSNAPSIRSMGRGSACSFAPISPPRVTPSVGATPSVGLGPSLGRGRGRGRGMNTSDNQCIPRKPHSISNKKDKC